MITKARPFCLFQLNITRTCSVTNMHLLALYELKKAEYAVKYGFKVDEVFMFYACSALQAYQMAKHNFDWREARPGQLGAGVAFSPDPKYATFTCRSKGKLCVELKKNLIKIFSRYRGYR